MNFNILQKIAIWLHSLPCPTQKKIEIDYQMGAVKCNFDPTDPQKYNSDYWQISGKAAVLIWVRPEGCKVTSCWDWPCRQIKDAKAWLSEVLSIPQSEIVPVVNHPQTATKKRKRGEVMESPKKAVFPTIQSLDGAKNGPITAEVVDGYFNWLGVQIKDDAPQLLIRYNGQEMGRIAFLPDKVFWSDQTNEPSVSAEKILKFLLNNN